MQRTAQTAPIRQLLAFSLFVLPCCSPLLDLESPGPHPHRLTAFGCAVYKSALPKSRLHASFPYRVALLLAVRPESYKVATASEAKADPAFTPA